MRSQLEPLRRFPWGGNVFSVRNEAKYNLKLFWNWVFSVFIRKWWMPHLRCGCHSFKDFSGVFTFLGIKYIWMKVQMLPNLTSFSKQNHGFASAEKREKNVFALEVLEKNLLQNSALFPGSDFFQAISFCLLRDEMKRPRWQIPRLSPNKSVYLDCVIGRCLPSEGWQAVIEVLIINKPGKWNSAIFLHSWMPKEQHPGLDTSIWVEGWLSFQLRSLTIFPLPELILRYHPCPACLGNIRGKRNKGYFTAAQCGTVWKEISLALKAG